MAPHRSRRLLNPNGHPHDYGTRWKLFSLSGRVYEAGTAGKTRSRIPCLVWQLSGESAEQLLTRATVPVPSVPNCPSAMLQRTTESDTYQNPNTHCSNVDADVLQGPQGLMHAHVAHLAMELSWNLVSPPTFFVLPDIRRARYAYHSHVSQVQSITALGGAPSPPCVTVYADGTARAKQSRYLSKLA